MVDGLKNLSSRQALRARNNMAQAAGGDDRRIHSVRSLLRSAACLLREWRRRDRERRQLARFTERDMHDLAISRSDIANECAKPFWRK